MPTSSECQALTSKWVSVQGHHTLQSALSGLASAEVHLPPRTVGQSDTIAEQGS